MIEPGAMEALVQLILWVVVGVSTGLVLALLLEVALWVPAKCSSRTATSCSTRAARR